MLSVCIMLNKCLSGHRLLYRWSRFPPKFPRRVLAMKFGSTYSEVDQGSKEGPQSPWGRFPAQASSAWWPHEAAGSRALTGYPSFCSVRATLTWHTRGGQPWTIHPTLEKWKGFEAWLSGLGPWWPGKARAVDVTSPGPEFLDPLRVKATCSEKSGYHQRLGFNTVSYHLTSSLGPVGWFLRNIQILGNSG